MKLSEITKNSILYAHNTKLQMGDVDIYFAPVRAVKGDTITVQIKGMLWRVRPDMENDMWVDDKLGMTFHTTLEGAAQEIKTHALIIAGYWEDKIKSMDKFINQK